MRYDEVWQLEAYEKPSFLDNSNANRVAGVFHPQPPQHPACGSARGVSQKLPSRSRVMNVHPQFFDRY